MVGESQRRPRNVEDGCRGADRVQFIKRMPERVAGGKSYSERACNSRRYSMRAKRGQRWQMKASRVGDDRRGPKNCGWPKQLRKGQRNVAEGSKLVRGEKTARSDWRWLGLGQLTSYGLDTRKLGDRGEEIC